MNTSTSMSMNVSIAGAAKPSREMASSPLISSSKATTACGIEDKKTETEKDRIIRHSQQKAQRKQTARDKAERYFQKYYPRQSVVRTSQTKFSKQEILLGDVLGKGAFGIVWEVNGMLLDTADSSLVDKPRRDAASRKFLAQQCSMRESPQQTDERDERQQQQQQYARYAIKALSNQTVNSNSKDLFFQGLVGLAMEARLLSQLEPHPHIIKLRAVADCSTPFHEDFFIVMDRLYGGTLNDRIQQWGTKQNNKYALWNALSSKRRNDRMWEQRYQACHDLASALCHLHHHRITHRDLKPQNIGYNIRGDLTLFDLGLSRELPSTESMHSDGTYKLTGYCGSPRYMAPEIANNRPYNETCDVYSYGVLAWQMLTTHKPYDGYRVESMKALVWGEPFARPEVGRLRHNRTLQSLISKAWSQDWKERPAMQDIRTTFRQELIAVQRNKNGTGGRGSDASTRMSSGSRM